MKGGEINSSIAVLEREPLDLVGKSINGAMREDPRKMEKGGKESLNLSRSATPIKKRTGG